MDTTRQAREEIPQDEGAEIALPESVTTTQWEMEQQSVQNPRIRSLLGSVRTLSAVLDSNYAILHCSPQRLHEIWRRVLRISELIRTELAPLVAKPSCIPELEAERCNTLMALELLESSVLRDVDLFPRELESGQLPRVRKLLCVSMGKLHAFLQDALARTVASDPRSRFDADYFLSQQFPQDVEEAEWLWASVQDLKSYLEGVQAERKSVLVDATERAARTQLAFDDDDWHQLVSFLGRLEGDLAPRLREVLSLRGIRFDEMEVLDRYASDLPTLATVIRELGSHTRDLTTALDSGNRATILKTTNKKLAGLLVSLDQRLRDLEAFVPFWLEEVSRRRALMLKPLVDDRRRNRHRIQGIEGEDSGTAER